MNESTPSKFSNSGEIEQISEYRRFNLFAIFACLFGLASAAVLVSPFLVVLPLLAIFLGACGLAAYRSRDDLGGRLPSWIGIALALFFISWASSEFLFERCVYYSEANGIVEDWLQMVVSGEREIAHQGMMKITQRQATGLSVDEYYAMDTDARNAMEEIFAEDPMVRLVDLGEDSKISLVKNINITHDLENTNIRQVFRISPPNGEPIDLRVLTIRQYSPAMGRANWIISGAELSKEPAPNIAEKVSSAITSLISQ